MRTHNRCNDCKFEDHSWKMFSAVVYTSCLADNSDNSVIQMQRVVAAIVQLQCPDILSTQEGTAKMSKFALRQFVMSNLCMMILTNTSVHIQ